LEKAYAACSGSQATVGLSSPALENLLGYTLKSNEFWDVMAIGAPSIFPNFTIKVEQDFSVTIPGTGTIVVLRQYVYWERKNGGLPQLGFAPIKS
jgi:hypothetical protein